MGSVVSLWYPRGARPSGEHLEDMQITANFEVTDLGHVLIVVGLFGPHARHMCERKTDHIFFGVGGIFGIHRQGARHAPASTYKIVQTLK